MHAQVGTYKLSPDLKRKADATRAKVDDGGGRLCGCQTLHNTVKRKEETTTVAKGSPSCACRCTVEGRLLSNHTMSRHTRAHRHIRVTAGGR